MNLQRQALQRRLGGGTVEAFWCFSYSFWVVPIVPPKKPAVGPHQLPSVWATWDDGPGGPGPLRWLWHWGNGGGCQNIWKSDSMEKIPAQPSEWNLIPLLFDLVIMLLIQPANVLMAQIVKRFFSAKGLLIWWNLKGCSVDLSSSFCRFVWVFSTSDFWWCVESGGR